MPPPETRVLCWWNNDESRIEFDVDANVRVTAVRRIGTAPATGWVSLSDGSRRYELPQNFTQVTVPTGQQARLQLTYDSVRDRYTGWAGEIITEG